VVEQEETSISKQQDFLKSALMIKETMLPISFFRFSREPIIPFLALHYVTENFHGSRMHLFDEYGDAFLRRMLAQNTTLVGVSIYAAE